MDVALGCLEGPEIWLGGGNLGPKLHPGVDFSTMIFYNLNNSGQDRSNEGPIFILSSVKVGHWVAQT